MIVTFFTMVCSWAAKANWDQHPTYCYTHDSATAQSFNIYVNKGQNGLVKATISHNMTSPTYQHQFTITRFTQSSTVEAYTGTRFMLVVDKSKSALDSSCGSFTQPLCSAKLIGTLDGFEMELNLHCYKQ